MLDSFKLPAQHFLEGFDETVRDPSRQLMEGDQLISLFVGPKGHALLLERIARPNVTERDITQRSPRRWPDWSEALDKSRPERENVYTSSSTLYD